MKLNTDPNFKSASGKLLRMTIKFGFLTGCEAKVSHLLLSIRYELLMSFVLDSSFLSTFLKMSLICCFRFVEGFCLHRSSGCQECVSSAVRHDGRFLSRSTARGSSHTASICG